MPISFTERLLGFIAEDLDKLNNTVMAGVQVQTAEWNLIEKINGSLTAMVDATKQTTETMKKADVANTKMAGVAANTTEEMKKTSSAFTGLQKTAIAASAAVTGIVAGAGGAAWTTFTGSIQLVSMQLARFFIPALVAAAQVAQDFAQILDQLTPDARDLLITMAALAVAAALVYVAVVALSSPMFLLAGAVLAAIVALKTLPDIIEWIRKQFLGVSGNAFIAAGQAGLSIMWDKFKSAAQVVGAVGQAGAEVGGFNALAEDFKAMLQESFQKNFGGMGKGIGDIMDLFGGGENKKPRRRLLFDFPKEMQPHFGAVEEARKGFQIGALKSPLEQEMLRVQREAFQDFVNEKDTRRSIKEILLKIAAKFGLG